MVKDYIMDLYEIERSKKILYSEDIMGSKAKAGKELEYQLAVKNIKLLEEILDIIEWIICSKTSIFIRKNE